MYRAPRLGKVEIFECKIFKYKIFGYKIFEYKATGIGEQER